MRRLLFSALLAVTLPAFADLPPKLEPIPAPPPPVGSLDGADEPQVTIVKKGETKVEEYRMNGKLYMMKVTPEHGTSYYLVDEQGAGNWVRREVTGPTLSVPMWVVHSF